MIYLFKIALINIHVDIGMKQKIYGKMMELMLQ